MRIARGAALEAFPHLEEFKHIAFARRFPERDAILVGWAETCLFSEEPPQLAPEVRICVVHQDGRLCADVVGVHISNAQVERPDR